MSHQKPGRSARFLCWIVAVAAGGAAVLAVQAQAAPAQECLDEVRDLAARHGTPSKPPTATPDRKSDITTQDLARSGGVIKPPAVDDKSVITPAPNAHDPMPTVPDVATNQKQQQDQGTGAGRAQLQAALTAARSQAERGNEEGCQEALERARTLAERTK